VIAATSILALLVARWDLLRKMVVIMYDLDDSVAQTFGTFCAAFETVAGASRIWNIDTTENTDDWKRHAGATNLITRKPAEMSYSAPPVVRTNVSIPRISGGRQIFYFFPDTILVSDGQQMGALTYGDLSVSWSSTSFVEDDYVPSDAQIIGKT